MARSGIVPAMRPRLLSLALVALVAAACGGAASTPSPTAAAVAPSAANPSVAASEAAASGGGGGTGSVDCTALQPAGAQLIIGAQILAQLRTPDAVASIKSGTTLTFDPDAFVAAMQSLHVLDGHATPLGDPKPAIDAYVAAGQAAKDLLAKDSVTQADIDAYLTKVGTVGDFLGKQLAITGALSAAGCS